jgi:dephospho-CoA kinase
MRALGLTGGIGMGKSTCANLMRQRGIRIVDTDELARTFVQPGQTALKEISDRFGSSILDAAGRLRRDALADLVFHDPAGRRQLEAILHPRILKAWTAQLTLWQAEGVTLAAVVIPLLFETGVESRFDATVCVACSPSTQQIRLAERGWSSGEIQRRSAAQLPVEEKMARSHFVIWTEGALEAHDDQLGRVLESR